MSSFYYDTPEQYEQHKNVVLAQDVKDKWYSREETQQSKLDGALDETKDEDDEEIGDMIDRVKTISN